MFQRKYLILLAMSGMLIAFDQLAKFSVTSSLLLGEKIELLEGFLQISRVHNHGAAFGIFSTLPKNLRDTVLLIVPGATLAVIFFVFFRLKESHSLPIYALSMIVGGALGNFVDRIRLGYVVDFLDFHWRYQFHFPAFNVADLAISTGVALLLLSILQGKVVESHSQEEAA